MTDDADTADTAEPAAPDDADASLAGQLLMLQRIDTEADQLTVRRKRLPERDDLSTRTDQMNMWERRRAQFANRLDELTTVIEAAESANAELTAGRQRLEAQMKTVIAPREAEALMHEIETINGKSDELDDKELAALEEQATLDDDLTAHLGNEESIRAALRSSDEALARVCDDIDAELVDLANQRSPYACLRRWFCVCNHGTKLALPRSNEMTFACGAASAKSIAVCPAMKPTSHT